MKTLILKMENKMNKTQIRKERLLNHYKSLENLASKCNVKKPDGKKISAVRLKRKTFIVKTNKKGEFVHCAYWFCPNYLFKDQNLFCSRKCAAQDREENNRTK